MSDIPNTALMQGRDRPFPWFCSKCRRKEVWRVAIPYESPDNHGGVVRVEALRVPQCKNCGELVFDHEAHEQLRQAIVDTTLQADEHSHPLTNAVEVTNRE